MILNYFKKEMKDGGMEMSIIARILSAMVAAYGVILRVTSKLELI